MSADPGLDGASDTRSKLVAAGVEIVDSAGVAALGIRSVAARAGVSHGAPRRYFPTLSDLIVAVAAIGVADLNRVLAPAMAISLEEGAVAYWRFALRRPGMFALVFRHDLLDSGGGDLRSTTGAWFTELVAAVGDPDQAMACWSAVHGLCVLAATRAPEAFGIVVDEAMVRRVIAEFTA